MLDFISNCKQTIIKYKKQLLIFALIPVFMFWSSLSGFATNLPLSSVPYSNTFWSEMRLRVNSSGSWSSYYRAVYNSDEYYTNFTDTAVFSGVSRFLYGFDNDTAGFEYPFNFESFDYYLAFNFMSYGSNYTQSNYDVLNLRLDGYDENNTFVYFDLPTIDISSFSQYNSRGFSVLSKIPDNININLSNQIIVICSSSTVFCLPANVSAFVYQVPKYTSEDSVSAVVNAINNQTNNIMNAGSGFGGTTSGILSGNDDLSGFIDDYTEIEQSMYDKFTENQSAVIGNFSGFSWGSLSTAVDWTSDYLNRIYDNSGDFRTMFMYPILVGIALIFIGRQGLTAYVRSRREK